jgi:hypothetical protein
MQCGSVSLSVYLRFQNQLCSPPAVLLWSWVFTVLDYWGVVSLPHPLSLGQGQWSVSWFPAVSLLWWFADYFSILQCHLTLGVAHWLRRWALWSAPCPISGSGLSPTCYQPFCLSHFVYWRFSQRSAPCPFPLLWCAFIVLPPLLCVSFQFLVYFLVVFGGGGVIILPRRLCWFIWEVAGEILRDAWFSPVWYAQCLPSRFGAGIWWRQDPSCFLSTVQCGEAFQEVGVMCVTVPIFLSALFPPSVAPASQQGSESWNSCCLLPCPSCHLGSSCSFLLENILISFCTHLMKPSILSVNFLNSEKSHLHLAKMYYWKTSGPNLLF